MEEMMQSRNVTVHAARWSARHRKKAIFGWLVFAPAAIVIGASVGMNTVDQPDQNLGQAHHPAQIRRQAESEEVQR
jgi:putative drug exporter of the RND superfamily